MRFDILAVFASLSAMAAADSMQVRTYCPALGACNSANGVFRTSAGAYNVNANEGCRGTSVPGMTEFCVDWGNNRAHFKFSHQATKRCLRQVSKREWKDGCQSRLCHDTQWDEVACNWRMPAPEEGAEELAPVSETVASVPTSTPEE